MMNTLILVCASAIAQADCTVDSATLVVQGPASPGLIGCAIHDQAYIAETSFAEYLRDGHYLKLRCTPGGRDPRAGTLDREASVSH